MFTDYDDATIKHLNSLWTNFINTLVLEADKRKVLSFLNMAGIVTIDDKTKKVCIWLGNEFAIGNAKKFFEKQLNKIIKKDYNPVFSVKFIVYDGFQSGKKHPLQLDLKKHLKVTNIKKTTKSKSKTMDILSWFSKVRLDSAYRFDNLVVGRNNQMAYSSAVWAVENLGKLYNPMFIYWDVWLGKTHILQAIWNKINDEQSKKVILYMPTSNLIDDIVYSIRKNNVTDLQKRFKWIDVLILDDIQFLAGKERTQEIFHNIFNDFYTNKKQIILSSDKPPRDLITLEARLRSRFTQWFVVDIKKPDFETRIAILQKKLIEKGEENIESEFLDIIAKHITDNVRELEWALNLLITKRKMFWDLTEKDVLDTLKTLWYRQVDKNQIVIGNPSNANTKSTEKFEQIVEFVSKYYDVALMDVRWKSRRKEVSLTRQMLMYIAKKNFDWTLEKIWNFFGWKNHATVLYAVKNFERLIKNDSKLYNDFMVILDETWLNKWFASLK